MFRFLRDVINRFTNRCQCGGKRITSPTVLVIHGTDITFRKSRYCPACTVRYMEKYLIMCAKCHQPILVGDPIAVSGDKYYHLCDCSPDIAKFGIWCEGYQILWSTDGC